MNSRTSGCKREGREGIDYRRNISCGQSEQKRIRIVLVWKRIAAKTYSFEEFKLFESFEITAQISNLGIRIGISCGRSMFMFSMDRVFRMIPVMYSCENGQKEKEMRKIKTFTLPGSFEVGACICVNFLEKGRFKNRFRRFRNFVLVIQYSFIHVWRIGRTASGENGGQFTRTYHRFHSWSMWFGCRTMYIDV